jgi:hypothetical protein
VTNTSPNERFKVSEEQPSSGMAVLERLGIIVSLLLSAGSVLFSFGILWTKVQQNEADIVIIKASNISQIDRLARIETKLDIVLDGSRGRPK